MIQAASKYTSVQTFGSRAPSGEERTNTQASRLRSSPAIYVPRLDRNPQLMQDWYWRELKSGYFYEYILRERAKSPARIRAVAKRFHGRKQNPQCDIVHRASIPAREFFRWKAQDPDFFSDDANLRSLKRDNPDMQITVPGMPMPRSRFKKVYGEKNTGQGCPVNPPAGTPALQGVGC